MTSDKQESIFKMLKGIICESVGAIPVTEEAIEITTPFLDWKGCPVSIFITNEGKITDGDDTINQLKSLRAIDDFEEWSFQEDYFRRYQIQRTGSSLEPINSESAEALLSYVQGIARIPGFFQPKPIVSSADNYPTVAMAITKDGLIEKYNLSTSQVLRHISSRVIPLKSGLKIRTDMSPNKKNVIIKVVSHGSGTTTDKRQHVGYKLYEQGLWKRENKDVQLYTILSDLGNYPRDSRELLEAESKKIIQTKEPEAKYEIAKVLVEG